MSKAGKRPGYLSDVTATLANLFTGAAILVVILGITFTALGLFETIKKGVPLVVNDKQTTWLETTGFIGLQLMVSLLIAFLLLRAERRVRFPRPSDRTGS